MATIERLLESEAAPNAKDHAGWTPLVGQIFHDSCFITKMIHCRDSVIAMGGNAVVIIFMPIWMLLALFKKNYPQK